MAVATLLNAVSTEYTDQFIICEYQAEAIGTDSTGLIEVSLPGKALTQSTYRNIPNVSTTGKTYIIEFINFSLSCSSRDFDLRIFNRNSVSSLNTINEVLTYLNQNLLVSDKKFEPFVIRNRDDILTNKLYLYVVNRDSISTGVIRIELVYLPIQNREF